MPDITADKVKNSLKIRYNSQTKLPRLFSEQTFNIAQSFIDLSLLKKTQVQDKEKQLAKQSDERLDSHERLYEVHEPLPLEQLFTRLPEDKKAIQKLIIYGRAGIGKTVLCQYLATQWANDKLLTEFQAVFWLRLRELGADLIDIGDARQPIWQVLLKHCLIETDWCGSDENEVIANQEAFLKWLQDNKDKILFILDGYDEIADKLSPALKNLLLNIYSYDYVLMTSSSSNIVRLGNQLIQFDRYLECIGFTNDNIQAFVEGYFTQLNNTTAITSLLEFLETHPNLWGFIQIPINLELIAWAHSQGQFNQEHKTLSQLYQFVIQCLIKVKQRGYSQIEWKAIEERLQQAKDFLTYLAYQAIQEKMHILPGVFIRKQLQLFLKTQNLSDSEWLAKAKQLLNDCYLLGLIKNIGEGGPDNLNQNHYFIHLSFQEFLAADFVAQCIIAFHKNQLDDCDRQALLIFVQQAKWQDYYRVMWWFVAGALRSKEPPALQAFFDLLLQKPRCELEITEYLLLGRCLDEAQSEAQSPAVAQHEAIVDGYSEMLKSHITRAELRNLPMFQELVTILKISPHLLMGKLAEQLLTLMRDSNSDVCETAIKAVGQLGIQAKPEHKAQLEKLKLDGNERIQQLATETLKKITIHFKFHKTTSPSVGRIMPSRRYIFPSDQLGKVQPSDLKPFPIINQGHDDMPSIINSISLNNTAKDIFAQLASRGYTWSMLKQECLLNATLSDDKRRSGKEFIQGLVEKRKQLDEQYYKAAVEKLFPEDEYGIKDDSDGIPKDDGTGFKLRYYKFLIFDKPVSSQTANYGSLSHAEIWIKTLDSEDLTSSIDTVLSVSDIDAIKLDRIQLPQGWTIEGYDKELLVQCALIYYFNEFNQIELHITSGESRDSKVYADGFINPRGYPKFDGRLKSKVYPFNKPPDPPFDLSFDNELKQIDKAIFYAHYKKRKQQQELAASLCSLREYFAIVNEDWKIFRKKIVNDWGIQNKQAFIKSLDAVFKAADEYWQYKDRLLKDKKANVYGVSALQGEAFERDKTVAAMNALYVEHLRKLAQQYQAVTTKHEAIQGDLTALRKKLNEIPDAQELVEENKATQYKSKLHGEQYGQSLKILDDLNIEVRSLRNTIQQSLKDLAELINEQQEAQIRANLFANDAYINRSAAYHVFEWMQHQSDIPINKKQVVMGSVLQQIGFRLLHLEQLKKAGRPIGEILYSVSKYGLWVADMLFGESNGYFGDKIFTEKRLNALSQQRILSRLDGQSHHTAFEYQLCALVNNDTRLATKIDKNHEIALHQKASQAELLIKRWIYRQNNPEQRQLSKHDIDSVKTPEVEDQLKIDRDNWLSIAKKVIRLTYASKLEQTNHLWGDKPPDAGASSAQIVSGH